MVDPKQGRAIPKAKARITLGRKWALMLNAEREDQRPSPLTPW